MATLESFNSAEESECGEPLPPLLDRDSAAWITSFGMHLLLLALLAIATLALPSSRKELDLTYEQVELIEEEILTEEFLSADEPMEEMGALSQGGEASALAAAPEFAEESLVVIEADTIADLGELPAIELEQVVLQGPEVSLSTPTQGVGSVGATGAQGAIDRITHEILISLEQAPTLVVWLFDESGSLKKERERISKRFERIYDELGVVEASKNPAFRKHKDKPLLTAVVGFGSQPKLITPKPTDQLEEIQAAVKAVREDPNDPKKGQENVFTAVAMAAEKFRPYRTASRGSRNVLFVVFTDEAGNDVNQLDATVNACQRASIPVYVVGRPAPFGRKTAYVKYVDPDPNYDQRPQWVPVSLGPESLLPERLKLNFVGRGDDDDLVDSGFGPYALTRLCYDTGGLYFAAHPNRKVGRRIRRGEIDNLSAELTAFFDPDAMRRYQPDYVPVQEYMQLVRNNRAKLALVEAAQMSWTSPMENVQLRFPKRDEASLAELLSRAQRNAALLQPKIDRLCQRLLLGETDRKKVREPRWQAGYDLAVGRALAVQVRTAGYNMMLAEAKQGMKFKGERNNVWNLRAGNDYASSRLEKTAEQAIEYLQRVQEDHPGTPWAMFAKEELKTPLGWEWRESYTPMQERNQNNGNVNPRPRMRPQMPQRPPRRDPPPL
ncbi:MAG: vWA domain-containing protein [Lacipirellulaceae bacterium]